MYLFNITVWLPLKQNSNHTICFSGANMQPIHTTIHRKFDKITEYRRLVSHGVNRFWQIFKASRFLFHTGRKINRFWLVHFKKTYVHQQILAREGSCRKCGTCCNLLFTCPLLSKKGDCMVYTACRPQACSAFPLNQKDIDEIKLSGRGCGYRFPAVLPENCDPKKES